MNSRSDLDIWQKIVSGNTNAFTDLFNKYYKPLYHFAGRFVRDPQTAENIVQDIFVNLWTNRHKLNIKIALKIYLYRAVKNRSLNYLTKQRRVNINDEYISSLQLTVDSAEQIYIRKEWQQAVMYAINKLPERCRQVYTMHRYDGLKYREIAQVLDISINTVKTQMKRAIKSLLKDLSQ